MKAPFPYFGGKSGGARLIWSRLGNTPGYIEPFAGSLAVLLARPFPPPPRFEVVNDLDGSIVNFWRSVKWSPEKVASFADWPRCELDLHARQDWIHERLQTGRDMLRGDMRWHDPEWAGVWCWAMSLAINPASVAAKNQSKPTSRPKGALALGRRRVLPDIMRALSIRLRDALIMSGYWQRAVTESMRPDVGSTAIFLDPPYSVAVQSDKGQVYSTASGDTAAQARTWAIENGDNPRIRIALCGYRGEHDEHMPGAWECCASSGSGQGVGYSAGREDSKALARREVVWFSPHCLRVHQPGLFDDQP